MISTDTWLKIICSMMINAVVFGFGAIAVMTVPVLNENAKFAIPAVVALSFVVSPLIASYIAPRMRFRNWGKESWVRGDLISG
ncbi:MAG: hypothetical protein BGN83_14570 [Rhizobium sp. 63-7]|nr:MAG: hypothetical protein BGN83_14570 [Rhizobium sp. 63-7]